MPWYGLAYECLGNLAYCSDNEIYNHESVSDGDNTNETVLFVLVFIYLIYYIFFIFLFVLFKCI